MNKEFITRVELHSSDMVTFTRFHEQMRLRKFRKTIISDDGHEYNLPRALYYSTGDFTAEAVRDLAWEAVAATALGQAAEIFTTQWISAAWSGLTRAISPR